LGKDKRHQHKKTFADAPGLTGLGAILTMSISSVTMAALLYGAPSRGQSSHLAGSLPPTL
jgi:hypothetical protein